MAIRAPDGANNLVLNQDIIDIKRSAVPNLTLRAFAMLIIKLTLKIFFALF